jgi:hypothetical protein
MEENKKKEGGKVVRRETKKEKGEKKEGRRNERKEGRKQGAVSWERAARACATRWEHGAVWAWALRYGAARLRRILLQWNDAP